MVICTVIVIYCIGMEIFIRLSLPPPLKMKHQKSCDSFPHRNPLQTIIIFFPPFLTSLRPRTRGAWYDFPVILARNPTNFLQASRLNDARLLLRCFPTFTLFREAVRVVHIYYPKPKAKRFRFLCARKIRSPFERRVLTVCVRAEACESRKIPKCIKSWIVSPRKRRTDCHSPPPIFIANADNNGFRRSCRNRLLNSMEMAGLRLICLIRDNVRS